MTISRSRGGSSGLSAGERRYVRAVRRAERRDRKLNEQADKQLAETSQRSAPDTFLSKPQALTPRGFSGMNGGRWGLMPQLATWVSSSVQVCGLFPFTVGSARPALGVPLGPDLNTWSLVYCDPVTWFQAGLLSNPSAMIFGLPGLGKSTLVIRWLMGLADRGHIPLVLGDIKGEYSATIRALGGRVIEVGPGRCTFNPLDLGALRDAADRIGEVAWVSDADHPNGGRSGAEVAGELRELAVQQAVTLVIALARMVRGKALEDYEETLIAVGVKVAHETISEPLLIDLVELLEGTQPNSELLHVTASGGAEEHRRSARRLLQTLRSILHGPMGVMFNGPTTVPIRLDAPGGVSVDLSGMRRTDNKVLAGVMLATWGHGFAAIDAQWELHKAGLATFRNPVVVGDELWKPMGLAPGMAALVDQLFRTNRTEGVAQVMVTHSPKDALKLPTHEDREMALGFAENAGMLVMFGLAKNALDALDETAVSMGEEERRHIVSWRSPRSFRVFRSRTGRPKPPPGAGKALIKVQSAAGIAVQVVITETERDLHDTNGRWNSRGTEQEQAA